MAKGRSPNYPSLTLWEAIEKARKVYNAENIHVAPREAVATALGYNSLNGASLTIIGALKRYELLEDSGDGLKVSANGVAIIEADEDSESYAAALKIAAFKPSVFSELRAKFGEEPPSDASLKKYLTQKGFLPKAADEAIRIYRDNLETIGEEDEYNGLEVTKVTDTAESTATAEHSYSFPILDDKKAVVEFPGLTDNDLAQAWKELQGFIELRLKLLAGKKG